MTVVGGAEDVIAGGMGVVVGPLEVDAEVGLVAAAARAGRRRGALLQRLRRDAADVATALTIASTS